MRECRIPFAYQGNPQLLLARAAPLLRQAVQRVPVGQRCGAVLLGPTGLGKSSAAAWLVRRWQAKVRSDNDLQGTHGVMTARELQGTHVAWVDAVEETDAERRYRLGSGEPPELTEACSADWLVFDDVGLATSPALVQLVLARRYQRALPTVVTSGLTAEQFTAHIGAASVRRIIEWQGEPGLLVNGHDAAAAA